MNVASHGCDMKSFFKVVTLLYTVLFTLFVMQIHPNAGDLTVESGNQMPEEQPVTISVQNEPLGQVLDKIGAETGIAFSVDVQWKTFPVSVSLYQTPLHKGLKRILANLNNVIIYESTDKVKIVILGKIEPSKQGPKYQPTPVYQQPGPTTESEPEPEEPDTPPEPEADPDEVKEEKPAADSGEANEGEKAEEPASEETAEEGSTEEKTPAEDAPEAPETPAAKKE